MKPILIIQNHPIESAGRISSYLEQRDIATDVIHPYKGDAFPNLEMHSAVINMGCPISVSDFQNHEWCLEMFDFLDLVFEKKKNYLGVCFGAQFMAANRGASVLPIGKKEIGVYDVTLNKGGQLDPIFTGFPETFPVFHWHGDMFGIPKGADLLARSTICPNQAIRCGKAIGLQFHLEADLDKLPIWLKEYSDELPEVSKSADDVLAEYKAVAENVNRLCDLLIGNFLKEVR